MLNLMWFKSDLRRFDNPALQAAISSGPTVAVYLVSDYQWQKHGVSQAKKSLIIRQVRCLEEQLKSLNVPLIVRNSKSFLTFPDVLMSLITEHSINKVYCNKEYELNEWQCERQVENLITQQGVYFKSFNDSCLIEPGTVRNKQGEPYKVFSAFKRAILKDSFQTLRQLTPRIKSQHTLSIDSDLSGLIDLECVHKSNHEQHKQLWPAGEDEAHKRARDACKNVIDLLVKRHCILGQCGAGHASCRQRRKK
jgi:deoxyribodipyrimidine photo-lyase